MNISTVRLFLKEIGKEDLENIHEMKSYSEVELFNTIGISSSIQQTEALLLPIIEA